MTQTYLMDLINLVTELIIWGFHSTCHQLAQLLLTDGSYFDVHANFEGACYFMGRYFLEDISFATSFYYFVDLFKVTGNFTIALAL